MPLFLPACTSPAPRPGFAELTWSHLPPFKLNVAQIEVVSEYHPAFKGPQVEHLFPIPPERALRRWVQDRLLAAGPSGKAKVIIKTAGVRETEIQRTEDLKAHFTTEQGQRYEGAVEVVIEIYDANGFRTAFLTRRAERTQTVPEDLTLNARERAWYDFTEALMRDFNAEMEKDIPAFLARHLL